MLSLLGQALERRAQDEVVKSEYKYDPAAFVWDCIEFKRSEGPTAYQNEILEELIPRKRIAARGPHGPGKTAVAAWITLWGILTADDVKVPTTASAWRQLTKFLWPEIHKWVGRLRWDKIGRAPFTRDELLALALKLGPTQEAFAVTSDNAALIEGAHAERIVYIFDEAKIIPDATWDAAEGAFAAAGSDTGAEAYALAISTPGEPVGRFYDIHARKPGYEDWWTRHIRLEEAIEAGRVSAEWAEQRRQQWGEGSAVYQNRVLGEFASAEEDGIIALAWIERANQRWLAWADKGKPLPEQMTAVGVDVARSGEDKTVLALRYGDIITELRRYAKEDTMETTGRVKAVLSHGGVAIVDVIGIGAGVVDRLREMKERVAAFNAGAGTDRKDCSGELGFSNMRSAAWWNLREMLADENGEIALPPDDMLTGDLTAPKWRPMSGGRIQIESKESIKKRIGRSTDDGDAVVQAFMPPIEEEPAGGFIF